MTLVLENKLDLLVVMAIRHGKSTMFMIPPMVINWTLWWYFSLSLSMDMKLMPVELAYDMQPMAWTQLHLMFLDPSCSY